MTIYFWAFGQQPLFGALTLVLWALAWAAGRSTLARRTRVALEHERDLSMATAEAHEARLALESQRRMLARDIHDLVGHSINVMVVHAGAGRRAVEADPTSARRALETIEEVGTAALDELDGLLGMLGQQHQDRAPLPGIANVAGLVERMRRSGLHVELRTSLDGDVGAPVGATVYRVVQEALTNTLRHADATTAVVELHLDGTEVTVSVADDGRGASGPPGRGLAGMAGRVAMHGGSLQHGDRPVGGYEVTARIPVGDLA